MLSSPSSSSPSKNVWVNDIEVGIGPHVDDDTREVNFEEVQKLDQKLGRPLVDHRGARDAPPGDIC